MPVVIDVRQTDDRRDVIHRAVQALAEGKLVVFPTETVYGIAASALHESAVNRLLDVKGRDATRAVTLAIRAAEEAEDYSPAMPPLAHRLARRCWPGPVTLVLDAAHPDSAVRQLPAAVKAVVCPQSTVGLRVPAHDWILSALHLLAGPVVLTSANRSGQPDAVNAEEVVAALGEDVELVLDDGPAKYGEPSSVLQIADQTVKVLRRGVLTESAIRRYASQIILIVCTGNTCRSPMAEAMLQARLAARLGCQPAELEQHGVMVLSAGIAAMSGGRATPEAIAALQPRGIDLTAHVSQPLTDVLVRFADVILTMTRGHREAIIHQWPGVAEKTFLLRQDHEDVADPIGNSADAYVSCAQEIDENLAAWLDQWEVEPPLKLEWV